MAFLFFGIVGLVLLAGIVGIGIAAFMSARSIGLANGLKQLAVGLGILTLLPMVVFYGVNLCTPGPDKGAYERAELKIKKQTASEDEKKLLDKDEEAVEEEQQARDAKLYRNLFWVGFPMGLLALVGGVLLRSPADGVGFVFGGIATAIESVSPYWDMMSTGLRFGALLAGLGVFVALGFWKLYPTAPIVSRRVIAEDVTNIAA